MLFVMLTFLSCGCPLSRSIRISYGGRLDMARASTRTLRHGNASTQKNILSSVYAVHSRTHSSTLSTEDKYVEDARRATEISKYFSQRGALIEEEEWTSNHTNRVAHHDSASAPSMSTVPSLLAMSSLIVLSNKVDMTLLQVTRLLSAQDESSMSLGRRVVHGGVLLFLIWCAIAWIIHCCCDIRDKSNLDSEHDHIYSTAGGAVSQTETWGDTLMDGGRSYSMASAPSFQNDRTAVDDSENQFGDFAPQLTTQFTAAIAAGKESRGDPDGNYRFGDFTRGLSVKTIEAVRRWRLRQGEPGATSSL